MKVKISLFLLFLALFLFIPLGSASASGWDNTSIGYGYWWNPSPSQLITLSFNLATANTTFYAQEACNVDSPAVNHVGLTLLLVDNHDQYGLQEDVTDLSGSELVTIVNGTPLSAGLHTMSVNCNNGEVKVDGNLIATSTHFTNGYNGGLVVLAPNNNLAVDSFTDFTSGLHGYDPINPYGSNQPPSINTLGNTTLNEGDTYSATGSFTDTDSTSWTGTVDYGDGGGSQPIPPADIDSTNHTFNLHHVYQDEGITGHYTVTVTLTDNQGATSQPATATVTVNNATPIVGAITVSTNPVQINNATSASASFTDSGVLDTHTAIWDWGDGTTPTSGTVTESNGSGTVGPDNHTYTAAGVYTITLTVTDDDGTQPGTQTFQYVSAYNPTSQGLFSAGQHFTSPAGAYSQNTSLTGTVKFGLSYKYQGTMPVGDKQFTMNFNAANLTFNATTISSLVIANGIGTLTGTGTLNGSGTYTFLVTGSESANTIRIQIKDSSNTVIYDTQPGAAAIDTPTTSVTGHVLAH